MIHIKKEACFLGIHRKFEYLVTYVKIFYYILCIIIKSSKIRLLIHTEIRQRSEGGCSYRDRFSLCTPGKPRTWLPLFLITWVYRMQPSFIMCDFIFYLLYFSIDNIITRQSWNLYINWSFGNSLDFHQSPFNTGQFIRILTNPATLVFETVP